VGLFFVQQFQGFSGQSISVYAQRMYRHNIRRAQRIEVALCLDESADVAVRDYSRNRFV
jgi:hypothetical protein